MIVEDLPLFAWRPKATVLPFPAARRAGLVRVTAARLLAEGDGVALAEGVSIITQDLSAAALTDADMWQHMWAFHKAVQAEIRRLDGRDRPHRGRR